MKFSMSASILFFSAKAIASVSCNADCSVEIQKTEFTFPRSDVAWEKVHCEEIGGKISLIGSMPSFATEYRCMRHFTDTFKIEAIGSEKWQAHRDIILECDAFNSHGTGEVHFWDYSSPTLGDITCG